MMVACLCHFILLHNFSSILFAKKKLMKGKNLPFCTQYDITFIFVSNVLPLLDQFVLMKSKFISLCSTQFNLVF